MQVAVLDDYQGLAGGFADWHRLGSRADVTFFDRPIPDRERLIETLQPFAIVCLMRERTPFPADVIDALPKLRLIVTTGMRNAAIDVAAAARRGITVCGTPSPGHATAELTFGLILSLARRIVPQANALRDGIWQDGVGRDLKGATLGIIGLGRLGTQVAGFGKAFGMDVIAWSRNLDQEQCAAAGVTYATKHALVESSDFVTIHLRLSDRTRGLIGTAELAAMKPDACLVNTSRGPIVDQAALIRALTSGTIGGAALDVFDEEPLPDGHPLLSAPNLLLTPHIGYVTRETYEVFYGETLNAIEAWLNGDPIRVIEA